MILPGYSEVCKQHMEIHTGEKTGHNSRHPASTLVTFQEIRLVNLS